MISYYLVVVFINGSNKTSSSLAEFVNGGNLSSTRFKLISVEHLIGN